MKDEEDLNLRENFGTLLDNNQDYHLEKNQEYSDLEINSNYNLENNFENILGNFELDVKKLKLIFKNQKSKVFRIYTKDNKFIAKISKNHENIYREAYCGIFCINNLEKYLPNFSKTYSLALLPQPRKEKRLLPFRKTRWKISKPNKINNTKSKINKEPNISFLIMENIQTYSTFKKILKKCNEKIFLEIMIQIINALHVAHIIYDFTHYDLHLGNILLIKEKTNIKLYQTLNNYEMYQFGYLIKIIDYEYSHFNKKGVHYGYPGSLEYKIKENQSYPIHDIYKLFMTCSFEIIKSHNYKIKYGLLKKIYKIFELGYDLDFTEIRDKYIYFQPPTRIKEVSYIEFLNILVKLYLEMED